MSRTFLPALLLAATTFLAPAVAAASPGPRTSATAGVRFGGCTFVVNAAAPGAGGELSGLNGGMGVSYSPDSAAFTFVP